MRGWWIGLLLLAACSGPRGDIEHGKRLATITGCISCHGPKLDGHLFEENPAFALAWSANLSRRLPGYSDAQIDATLRSGRRPDGSALWFMPTFTHRVLSAGDMRDVIAWLRTVPPTGSDHPPIKFGPEAKAALAMGFADSAAQAERLARREPAALDKQTEQGRYLTRIACAECHGPDLVGPKNPQVGDPPDLSVVAGYSVAQLTTLLRTGVAPGGRKVGFMSEEAPKRLSALTDAEIAAIHAYLTARAKAAKPR